MQKSTCSRYKTTHRRRSRRETQEGARRKAFNTLSTLVSAFLRASAAVSCFLLRLFADHFTIDDDARDVTGVFEGVAVKERHVRVLARFQRADAIAYA